MCRKNCENCEIPSLILQPLVENSIKHAISENKKGGTVKYLPNWKMQIRRIYLVLQVIDSGAGEERKILKFKRHRFRKYQRAFEIILRQKSES